LKGVFMAVTGVYIVLRVVRRYYGGIPELFHRLATESPAHLTLPGPEHFVTYTFWTTTLLVSLCAFYMWPHLFAKFYAAESPRVIQKQAIFLPLYNVLTLMFMLVGFAGILILPRIRPDTVMVEMIMRVAPLWLVALFCTGALSASMITGAACSLAAAATLGNDLIQPRLGLEDVKLRKLIQGLVFLVVAAAYVMALLRPATIVYMILMAYGFTAQLFPLVLAAVYKTNINTGGAIAGLLVGLGIVAFLVFGPENSPFGIHPGLLGLVANITTMLLVTSYFKTLRRTIMKQAI
jgi:SSS family solute:Na+ symporter